MAGYLKPPDANNAVASASFTSAVDLDNASYTSSVDLHQYKEDKEDDIETEDYYQELIQYGTIMSQPGQQRPMIVNQATVYQQYQHIPDWGLPNMVGRSQLQLQQQPYYGSQNSKQGEPKLSNGSHESSIDHPLPDVGRPQKYESSVDLVARQQDTGNDPVTTERQVHLPPRAEGKEGTAGKTGVRHPPNASARKSCVNWIAVLYAVYFFCLLAPLLLIYALDVDISF